MPDAELTLWDPVAQGKPTVGFDWRRYDALLLDDAPGAGADGLEWLTEFRAEGPVPPTLVLSDTGGEDMAVKAVKAGAADYLKKPDLTPIRLAMAIKEAMIESVEISREMLAADPAAPDRRDRPAGGRRRSPTCAGYRVLRKIGEGGMSRVFLAERESDGLQLVLKMLDTRLARDPQSQARFVREYKIIQRIQNEHVVMIFDQGFTVRQPVARDGVLPGRRPARSASRRGSARWARSRSWCRSPKRWTPSIPPASCTATSSRRTSCSAPTTGSRSSTSGSRASSTRPPRSRRRAW